MVNETNISKSIQLEGSKLGLRLFRNNRGAFKDKRGVWVKYGIGGDGGSDLIGFKRVKITQAMVGKSIAIFTACEVKKPNSRTDPQRLRDQIKFISSINNAGGIGMMVDNVEEFINAVR